MSVVKISQKGWVVIPAEVRKNHGWKPGDHLKVVDYGDVVGLVPVLRNPEDEAMGILKRPGRSLLAALKEARDEERRRDKSRR